MAEILTIGHSTLSMDSFLGRLKDTKTTMLIDVRSRPYSRYQPHFSIGTLQPILCDHGIDYSFFGDTLGDSHDDRCFYTDGMIDYAKLSLDRSFITSINQLIARTEVDTIAIMCSEGQPLECHRCLHIGRALKERNCLVMHLTTGSNYITQREAELCFLELSGSGPTQSSLNLDNRLNIAYRFQAKRVRSRYSFQRG